MGKAGEQATGKRKNGWIERDEEKKICDRLMRSFDWIKPNFIPTCSHKAWMKECESSVAVLTCSPHPAGRATQWVSCWWGGYSPRCLCSRCCARWFPLLGTPPGWGRTEHFGEWAYWWHQVMQFHCLTKHLNISTINLTLINLPVVTQNLKDKIS